MSALMPKDYTDAIDALIVEDQKGKRFCESRGDKRGAENYEYKIMAFVEAKAAIVKTWRGKQAMV